MNQIAELLPARNILLDLDAGSKASLFDAVGALFETNHGALAPASSSTAWPRARSWARPGSARASRFRTGASAASREAQGAFVRLKSPIPFDAPDGKPVAQVFVLLVPEQATEQHLQLLSELAQMFSETRFRESLAARPTRPDCTPSSSAGSRGARARGAKRRPGGRVRDRDCGRSPERASSRLPTLREGRSAHGGA